MSKSKDCMFFSGTAVLRRAPTSGVGHDFCVSHACLFPGHESPLSVTDAPLLKILLHARTALPGFLEICKCPASWEDLPKPLNRKLQIPGLALVKFSFLQSAVLVRSDISLGVCTSEGPSQRSALQTLSQLEMILEHGGL